MASLSRAECCALTVKKRGTRKFTCVLTRKAKFFAVNLCQPGDMIAVNQDKLNRRRNSGRLTSMGRRSNGTGAGALLHPKRHLLSITSHLAISRETSSGLLASALLNLP